MFLGKRIKELGEEKELLQRQQLTTSLEINTPMYSKIEREERKAKREQVLKLAKLLETKGDYLDNDNSRAKNALGKKWAEKAGDHFKYFMVFEKRKYLILIHLNQ